MFHMFGGKVKNTEKPSVLIVKPQLSTGVQLFSSTLSHETCLLFLKVTVLNTIKNQSSPALIVQGKFRAEANLNHFRDRTAVTNTQTQLFHQVHDLTLREVAEAISLSLSIRKKKYYSQAIYKPCYVTSSLTIMELI